MAVPYLLIQTNRPVSDRAGLLRRASEIVAKALGKPERYVMVAVEADVPMLFGGSDAPCVYMELKSIGLPEARTAELSATLCGFAQQELGVNGDRTYVEFADAARHMWGFNGKTFA